MPRLTTTNFLPVLLLLGTVILSSCSPKLRPNQYTYLLPEARPGVRVATGSAPRVSDERPAPASRPAVTGQLSALQPLPSQTHTVINTAKSYLGTPYRFGGLSQQGIDCSGLVYLSYQSINKQLPRNSQALAQTGRPVPRSQLQPGDLVFFDAKRGQTINHVGLVVEREGEEIAFIHATTSAGVRIDRLSDPYWETRFLGGVAP